MYRVCEILQRLLRSRCVFSFRFIRMLSRCFYPKQHIIETWCVQLSSPGLQASLHCYSAKIKARIWQFCQMWVWTFLAHILSCGCESELSCTTLDRQEEDTVLLESPPALQQPFMSLQDKSIPNNLSPLANSLSLSLTLHALLLDVILIHFSCCVSSHTPDLSVSSCCSTPALFFVWSFLHLLPISRSFG